MSIFNLIVSLEFLTARFSKQKGFLIFEDNAYNAQYIIILGCEIIYTIRTVSVLCI